MPDTITPGTITATMITTTQVTSTKTRSFLVGLTLVGILVSTACGSELTNVGAAPTVELISPPTATTEIIYVTVVVSDINTALAADPRQQSDFTNEHRGVWVSTFTNPEHAASIFYTSANAHTSLSNTNRSRPADRNADDSRPTFADQSTDLSYANDDRSHSNSGPQSDSHTSAKCGCHEHSNPNCH